MQGEVCMEWNKEVTERVRGAMRDRARVMACLCGELEKILLSDKAEAAARKAITSYGCIRAERDGHKITPDEWVDIHYRDMGGVFETEITKSGKPWDFPLKSRTCIAISPWSWTATAPPSTTYRAISSSGSARATAFAASACGKKPGPNLS